MTMRRREKGWSEGRGEEVCDGNSLSKDKVLKGSEKLKVERRKVRIGERISQKGIVENGGH